MLWSQMLASVQTPQQIDISSPHHPAEFRDLNYRTTRTPFSSSSCTQQQPDASSRQSTQLEISGPVSTSYIFP